MNRIIQDIWIIDPAGIALYNNILSTNVNQHLFSSFLTAINAFAKKVANSELSSFIVGSTLFTLLKSNNFLFVASSSPQIKEKVIYNELKKISRRFFEKYSNLLRNWNYNVRVFDDFGEDIKELLNKNQVMEFLKCI
ncbi:MAG: hypothetical protein ACFFAO_03955 [Candidatus Hermodarchaeota archaeon]